MNEKTTTIRLIEREWVGLRIGPPDGSEPDSREHWYQVTAHCPRVEDCHHRFEKRDYKDFPRQRAYAINAVLTHVAALLAEHNE